MADLVPESEQQYGSILTVFGESAEQNGKMLKKPVEFTHIAFGDANDTYVQPDRKAQSLVNELYRIPVNSVDVLQATPDSVPILTVEALLPDHIHDVVIREFAAVATFNGQEYFHAIGNCARIYVPSPINNGQLNNPVSLEMTFVITSAEPIVVINPNVITASRDYVHRSIAKDVGKYTDLVFKTVEHMKNAKLTEGDSVKVTERGARYRIVSRSNYAKEPDGFGDHYISNDLVAVLDYRGRLKADWFGDEPGALVRAIEYLSPNGGAIDLSMRDYNIVGEYIYDAQDYPDISAWRGNEVKNIKIFGSGMPEYSEDGSRFVSGSGTVIQGTLLNWSDGFECYDVGIDCGQYVVDTLSGGKYLEGFIPSTQKNFSDTAAEPEKYFKNIHFGNIKTLLKDPTNDPSTFKHSILFEHCFNGSYSGHIEVKCGYHGFVLKSQHIVGSSTPHIYGTKGTSYILKSDQWSECCHLKLSGFKVGMSQAIKTAPALYEARDGVNLSDITIDSITGINCCELFSPAGTDRITDIQIGRIRGSAMYGSNGAEINNQCDRVTVGQHSFVGVDHGFVVAPGCSQIDIGTGHVRKASKDCYDLAGDVTHGRLTGMELSAGCWVVRNRGYVPDPSLINRGDKTGLGSLDKLWSMGVEYQAPWSHSAWYPLEVTAVAGKLNFNGFVNSPTNMGTGTIFVLPESLRPKRNLYFSARALVNGNWQSPVSIIVSESGNVETDATDITDIDLTGISFVYNT